MARFRDGHPRAWEWEDSVKAGGTKESWWKKKSSSSRRLHVGSQGTSSQNKEPLHSQGRKELDLSVEEFLSFEVVNITWPFFMGKKNNLKLLRTLQKLMLKKWVCVDCGRDAMMSQVAIPREAALQLPCVQSQQCVAMVGASLQAGRTSLCHNHELGYSDTLGSLCCETLTIAWHSSYPITTVDT